MLYLSHHNYRKENSFMHNSIQPISLPPVDVKDVKDVKDVTMRAILAFLLRAKRRLDFKHNYVSDSIVLRLYLACIPRGLQGD